MKKYIWVQDHSWDGCIVVVAENIDEAREKMKKFGTYEKNEPVESFEIDGFEYVNQGDW